jgi:hypothetical protein
VGIASGEMGLIKCPIGEKLVLGKHRPEPRQESEEGSRLGRKEE